MNVYALIVLVALLVEYGLSVLSSALTLRALSPELPAEFQGVIDADRYARSQEYTRLTTRFGLVRTTITLVLLLAFWHLGGFEWLDASVRGFGFGPVGSGLLFVAALVLMSLAASLPFHVYGTFVIEARFGFNRTTLGTFVADLLKSLLLMAVLGGTLMTLILWFFESAGPLAWLWCWLTATAAALLVQFIAPIWLLPLFNRFTPLGPGVLRDAILAYTHSVSFPVRDLFVVDGSRRSTKANAFFAGLGRYKRIGLYDTLVNGHSPEEVVAIVAHEVGHYKKGHIPKSLVLQVAYLGALFFVLSLVLQEHALYEAFYLTETSVYAGLTIFGLLFTPADLLLSLYVHAVSRRNELEADAFAASTTGSGEPMITALKKLSADTLTNLTPSRLQVVLRDSHPPVLERIAALREA